MKYLVRSGALLGYPELVSALGASPLELIAKVGIPPAVFQNSDLYISYFLLARVLNDSALACHRQDFGALLAAGQGLEVTGALAPMLCLQPTMAHALEMIQKHLDFHARGVLITATQERGELCISIDFHFARQTDCTQLVQLSLGLLHRVLEQLYGNGLTPIGIELRQPPPATDVGCSRLFGPTIVYGATADRVRYPADILTMPLAVDANLRERLSQAWRHSSEGAGLALAQQVERAVIALLPTGDCSLSNVAGLVGLHPRVLQDQLKSQGTRFSNVLAQAREQLAREHLQHSSMNMTELAAYLGYSEVAVFSRNFKKWTGFSPLQWRKQCAS